MFNEVTLIGRLGREPEIAAVAASGKQVAKLAIATTHSYKNGQGEKIEETEWHKIALFNGLASIAQSYLHKGDLVLIKGRIKTQKWKDQEGNDKYLTEIIGFEMKMLGSRSQNQTAHAQGQQQASQPQPVPQAQHAQQAQQPVQQQTYHAQAQPQQQPQQPVYQQAKEPIF